MPSPEGSASGEYCCLIGARENTPAPLCIFGKSARRSLAQPPRATRLRRSGGTGWNGQARISLYIAGCFPPADYRGLPDSHP